ncbi:TMEM175 family protein [Streptomyces sp. NPDC005202]|uniref:TMEM175 family protein n=1 Tax=Streptomyces sp. NPDC005202 TaxID=3157021 RepID=UPI0033AD114B
MSSPSPSPFLILEIKVPEVGEHGGLWHALGAQWPSYAANVVSFLVIGIMGQPPPTVQLRRPRRPHAEVPEPAGA